MMKARRKRLGLPAEARLRDVRFRVENSVEGLFRLKGYKSGSDKNGSIVVQVLFARV